MDRFKVVFDMLPNVDPNEFREFFDALQNVFADLSVSDINISQETVSLITTFAEGRSLYEVVQLFTDLVHLSTVNVEAIG